MLAPLKVEGLAAAIAAAVIIAFAPVAHAAKVRNAKPVISGAPAASASVGVAYRFTPSATDADGDRLTFSIVNKPAWAAFDSATGALSGAPTATGVHKKIKIVVSDGRKRAKLAPFTITVGPAPVVTPPPVTPPPVTPPPPPPPPPANSPPKISGTPALAVTAGQAYAFQATATDPDAGQTLRFGIANKPAWATFDIVTGRLSGTPATANVGEYANIVVSVSDGALSATLPAFTITVVAPPPPTGKAELTWTAPTQNEDGSALTNLAGYRIRYGKAPGELTQVVTIASPSIMSAEIEGLAVGTWYFAMTSYTNTGVESAPTGTVQKTVM